MSDLMIEVEEPHQGLRLHARRRQGVVQRAARRGARLPGPERRRQVDHDEDADLLPGADGGPARGRRPRRVRRVARGPQRIGYLPEDTPIYRDMTVLEYLQFAAEMRGMDRRQGRRAHQGDRQALRPGRRRRQAGRRAVEGLPAARRPGAGDAPRPRHPHPRRADERPRPQPDRRDPVAHQGDRPREDGHPVDAHPPRGAGDLQPHRHHQRRQAGRRRHAGRAARARARRPLPRGRRIERRRPRTPIRDRLASLAGVTRCETVARRGRRRTPSPSTRAAADDLRKPIFRAAVDNRWTLLELVRESASLEDVFRNLTTGEKRSKLMNPALVISRREIRTYFNSPVAYIVVTVVHDHHRLPVLHAAVPREAGRACAASSASCRCCSCSWSRPSRCACSPTRRSSGTLELLITMPVRDWEVVRRQVPGGAWPCCARRCGLTLVFAITVRALGPLDRGPAIGGYLGLLLMGGAYVAIGVMASAFTRNSIVAFIVAFAHLASRCTCSGRLDAVRARVAAAAGRRSCASTVTSRTSAAASSTAATSSTTCR